MRRREFVIGGSAAAALPVGAVAQQLQVPVVGILDSVGTIAVNASRVGLAETGYIEGRNVAIELRAAEQYDRLAALAIELSERKPAVIIALGGPSAPAAKAATMTIPIVFSIGGDPVELGLVSSLNRPGGNITGITFFTAQLLRKQVSLLLMLRPDARTFGVLINPNNKRHQADVADLQQAAQNHSIELVIVKASTDLELGAAFADLASKRVAALIICGDPYFLQAQRTLAAMAVRDAVPSIKNAREYAVSGGLMSYGASLTEAYREAGVFAGRILNGEKPSDLPVIQPTKFALVINLKTAKALGLTIPPNLLALADEVIE
jgi:putative ABC transport system substrate-binding protein